MRLLFYCMCKCLCNTMSQIDLCKSDKLLNGILVEATRSNRTHTITRAREWDTNPHSHTHTTHRWNRSTRTKLIIISTLSLFLWHLHSHCVRVVYVYIATCRRCVQVCAFGAEGVPTVGAATMCGCVFVRYVVQLHTRNNKNMYSHKCKRRCG